MASKTSRYSDVAQEQQHLPKSEKLGILRSNLWRDIQFPPNEYQEKVLEWAKDPSMTPIYLPCPLLPGPGRGNTLLMLNITASALSAGLDVLFYCNSMELKELAQFLEEQVIRQGNHAQSHYVN